MASKLFRKLLLTTNKDSKLKSTKSRERISDLIEKARVKRRAPVEFVEKVQEVTINCKKYKIDLGERTPSKVNVSIWGSLTRSGKIAAMLLTHSNYLNKIYLYDKTNNELLADDLMYIDKSPAVVRSYYGKENSDFENAFRAADIAVLVDTDRKFVKVEEKFEASYKSVKEFAEKCSIYCPRAVMILCVDPLCCVLPYVNSIYDETPWFDPSKIFGNVSLIQGALNTIAANYLSLNPTSVHIPMLGGPDVYTAIPLISQMTPDPGLTPYDQIRFYELIKSELIKSSKDLIRVPSTLNDGYAIARMVTTVAKGLCGERNATSTAFVRTNIAPQVRYLVSTVKFGRGGIYKNYGLPKLTSFEVEQLLCAITLLNDRDKMVKKFLDKSNIYNQQITKCN